MVTKRTLARPTSLSRAIGSLRRRRAAGIVSHQPPVVEGDRARIVGNADDCGLAQPRARSLYSLASIAGSNAL